GLLGVRLGALADALVFGKRGRGRLAWLRDRGSRRGCPANQWRLLQLPPATSPGRWRQVRLLNWRAGDRLGIGTRFDIGTIAREGAFDYACQIHRTYPGSRRERRPGI